MPIPATTPETGASGKEGSAPGRSAIPSALLRSLPPTPSNTLPSAVLPTALIASSTSAFAIGTSSKILIASVPLAVSPSTSVVTIVKLSFTLPAV